MAKVRFYYVLYKNPQIDKYIFRKRFRYDSDL